MNRKDTILIAVVINAGLLAILFTTAIIYDTDKIIEPTEFLTPPADSKNAKTGQSNPVIAAASTGDEVDNVLKYYSNPPSQPIVVETHHEVYLPEPIAVQSNSLDDNDAQEEHLSTDLANVIEVTVKKGDSLDKIARANGSTITAIKEANHLSSERLSIGQILKVPKKTSSAPIATASSPAAAPAKPNPIPPPVSTATTGPVYHEVKSGDSPWKIAKQYNVDYEDILRLNNLDEKKARNLKIGDRIRVK